MWFIPILVLSQINHKKMGKKTHKLTWTFFFVKYIKKFIKKLVFPTYWFKKVFNYSSWINHACLLVLSVYNDLNPKYEHSNNFVITIFLIKFKIPRWFFFAFFLKIQVNRLLLFSIAWNEHKVYVLTAWTKKKHAKTLNLQEKNTQKKQK